MIDIFGCLVATKHSEIDILKANANGSKDWNSTVILTDNTKLNFKKLSQSIRLNVPIIIQSEAGCGKSFLIHELANKLGFREFLVEINVDDQTDIKSLFGSYVCSEIPGEFIWQSGVITKAAVSGYWLIIEDIDKVPRDFIAAMLPLLERKKIPAPERGPGAEIDCHIDFRVIGTRVLPGHIYDNSSSLSSSIIPSMKHLSFAWHIVTLSKLSRDEIKLIIRNRFKALLPCVIDQLMITFDLLQGSHNKQLSLSDSNAASSSSSLGGEVTRSLPTNATIALISNRSFTMKDLIKVCKRIQYNHSSHFNHKSNHLTDHQRILCVQEVIDVYINAARDLKLYHLLTYEICKYWGIGIADTDALILNAQPQLTKHSDEGQTVTIGRIHINSSLDFIVSPASSGKSIANKTSYSTNQSFAYTRHDLKLLEKLACCVKLNEPVLLVGETGSGKTTSIQEIANLLDKKLIVQNLSLSTDTGDLLGGYRPITIKQLMITAYESFIELFQKTFSNLQNENYLKIVSNLLHQQKWNQLIVAFQKAVISSDQKIQQQLDTLTSTLSSSSSTFVYLLDMQLKWKKFNEKIQKLKINLPKIDHGFAFASIDGLLVQAMKKGYWLLLDEINLATSETLQSLSNLLENQIENEFEQSVAFEKSNSTGTEPSALSSGSNSSKTNVKGLNVAHITGSNEQIFRHPDFRIFAAMNPPTDVGKRELPSTLRCRFTEIYTPEMLNSQDLEQVVYRYMSDITSTPVSDIVSIYLGCRTTNDASMSDVVSLADSGGQKPHYSLRSLTRSLRASKTFLLLGIKPINRALFEAFLLNFQTCLSMDFGRQYMYTFLKNSFNISTDKDLNTPPTRPKQNGKQTSTSIDLTDNNDNQDWVLIKPFWLKTGRFDRVDWTERSELTNTSRYVLTKTAEKYIRDIASGIAANVAPILLQGPTSTGKTTMIEYLAAKTGHKCVRINNHEHTDVQEYIGGYITNSQGKLEFQDGLLVQALRYGYWIIL